MGVTDYKEAAKKRRTSKNYVFKGNRYTKSIEQTEDEVSTTLMGKIFAGRNFRVGFNFASFF